MIDQSSSKPEIIQPGISGVRDRIRVLFINAQERAPMQKLSLPHHREWILGVTQLPEEQVTVVNVADGEELPTTIDVHGVIGGGSEHSAFENLPWIDRTKAFFKEAQQRGIPELHFCWSHQAKAESEGGKVITGEKGRRFGIERLKLTLAGQQDPLFRDLPTEFDIFTSHSDVVETKPGSSSLDVIELAKSSHYPYEALAYGATARTLQSHPELTAEIITPFANARRNSLIQEGHIGGSAEEFEAYLESFRRQDERIRRNCRKMVDNWIVYFVTPCYNRLDLDPLVY